MTSKAPIYTIIDNIIHCSEFDKPIKPSKEFNILECRRQSEDHHHLEDGGTIKNFNWSLWPGIKGVKSPYPAVCNHCHVVTPGTMIYAVPMPFDRLGDKLQFKWICKECMEKWL